MHENWTFNRKQQDMIQHCFRKGCTSYQGFIKSKCSRVQGKGCMFHNLKEEKIFQKPLWSMEHLWIADINFLKINALKFSQGYFSDFLS